MLRSSDLEAGNKSAHIRRRRRRTFWRLPLSIAFSTLLIFIFFVTLGTRRTSTSGKPVARPKKANQGQPTLYTYAIMAEFPHDAGAFTQGLEYHENCEQGSPCKQVFFESTGLRGQSTVREVELLTGKVLRSKSLPNSDFGEGITKLGDRLYQLTWQSGKAWSYAADDFEKGAKEFKTPLDDGWGITSNGTHLFVSDSSDILYVLDPSTMQIVQELQITDVDQPVKWVNELEWVDGLIYGNIYTTECIAQIDPNTGTVVGWMVLDGLKSKMMDSLPENQKFNGDVEKMPDVLNGIAWDTKHSRLFVTGKLWPKLYQIESRPMYLDSKATDVAGIMQNIRQKCIIGTMLRIFTLLNCKYISVGPRTAGSVDLAARCQALTDCGPSGVRTPFSDKGAMFCHATDRVDEAQVASGRIFLGRLREDVDRETLIKTLSKFGNVLDARIVAATKDGYRKRFAFCDLETIEAATAAINALHGSTDLGAPLVVTHSTDTRPSPNWSSAAPPPLQNYHSTTAINTNNHTSQQQFSGTRPSSYGLAWQPQHTMQVVTPPPPPPPAAATKKSPTVPQSNTTGVPERTASSSSSSEGVVAPPNAYRAGSPVATATVAVPVAVPAQQQQEQYPQKQQVQQYHGHVPSHMMHHPAMPVAPAAPQGVHMPAPVAAPVFGPSAFETGELTTLYVRNLPIEMDEMGLLHYYMPFGAVVGTKILRNLDTMTSRGAGFIEFFTRQESDAALRGTNRILGPAGRELLVRYADRQLHNSRGAAAVLSAPVWPVMPYPASTAAAASAGAGVPGAAAAVPVPFPVSMPVSVGYMGYGPAPPHTGGNGTQKDSAAAPAGAGGAPAAVPHPATHQVALAVGHPIHHQAYHSYNPYQYHPSNGGTAAAVAVSGWQHQQHQHTYYASAPSHHYHNHHQQQQQYGYPNYQHHQHHQYAPNGTVNYQQQRQPQQGLQAAKPADSSGSDTTTSSSNNAVRRPGDPVVVVYSNVSNQQHQKQSEVSNKAINTGNNHHGPGNGGTGAGAVQSAPQYSIPYPNNTTTSVQAGARYPLRNLSINGSGGSQSHSAATTPGGAMPLGLPQKHIGSGGNGSGSGGGNGHNLPVGLERTSSDPFPSALSPAEMEAICSRVKAAARNVIHANNNASAVAVAAKKKVHPQGHGGGGGGGGDTPDIIQRINKNGSSASTLDSEDSSISVADSVGSCVSSAVPAVSPAERTVAGVSHG